jgi:hypothetical protein
MSLCVRHRSLRSRHRGRRRRHRGLRSRHWGRRRRGGCYPRLDRAMGRIRLRGWRREQAILVIRGRERLGVVGHLAVTRPGLQSQIAIQVRRFEWAGLFGWVHRHRRSSLPRRLRHLPIVGLCGCLPRLHLAPRIPPGIGARVSRLARQLGDGNRRLRRRGGNRRLHGSGLTSDFGARTTRFEQTADERLPHR